MIVGAWSLKFGGTGRVYVLEHDGKGWVEQTQLFPFNSSVVSFGNQLDLDVEAYLDQVPSFDGAKGEGAIAPGSQALRISGQIRFRGEVRDHLYSDDPDGANG